MKTLFDNFSFGIIRTNPKLTTNVKLVVSSDGDLYLSSFDGINTFISSKQYKNVKVSPNSLFNYDLHNFWGKGNTPLSYVYQVKPTRDFTIKDDFKDQYEEVYNYGFEINRDPYHKEEFKIFAPLWLRRNLPDKFIVVRIDGPILNGVQSDLLENSTIVKTFDLKNSSLSTYLTNYINQEQFPQSSLFVDYTFTEFTKFVGISIKNGGFVQSGELSKDGYTKDMPMIQFEEFITLGFERTGTVLANLMNLEFLFDDDAADFDNHRYIGLYVNEFADGTFDILSSETLSTNVTKVVTNGTTYDYSNVGQTNSLFYAKSPSESMYTVFVRQPFLSNELIIKSSENIVSLFEQFSNVEFSLRSYPITKTGRESVIIRINGNMIPNNYLAIGINAPTYTLYANDSVQRASFNGNQFSNQGSAKDIAFALNGAINAIADNRLMSILIDATTLLVYSINTAVSVYDMIYTNTNVFDNGFTLENNGVFAGSFASTDNKLAVTAQYKDYFNETDNLYVKTKTGYSKILNVYTYMQDFDVDSSNRPIKFYKVNDLIVIELDSPASVDNIGNIQFVTKLQSSFGRLSIVPMKDFDFDFYSTEYGFNHWDEFYTKMYYTNYTLGAAADLVASMVVDNNTFYPTKTISNSKYYDYLNMIDMSIRCINNEYIGNNNSVLISTYKANLTAVKQEFYNFMFDSFGFIIEYSVLENTNGTMSFNQEDYFKELRSLLGVDDLEGKIDGGVDSEYSRLNENFTKEFAATSRTIPYISKWTKEFTDVKDMSYRLNTNLAFGTENFSPSFYIKDPTPQLFTHEWYLLGRVPSDVNGPLSNFIDVSKLNDPSLESVQFGKLNGLFEEPFDLQRYLTGDTDYFTEYFTVERIPYLNNGQIEYKYITPQIRYTEFDRFSRAEFAETFFRGVKIFGKVLKQSQLINNNVRNIEYIKNDDLVDYKFAAILVPVYLEYSVEYTDITNTQVQSLEVLNDGFKYDNVEIKVYKDDRYKNILFYIQVKIPHVSNLQAKRIDIDYNVLYNLKSLLEWDGSTITYLPTPLSGSLDLSNQVSFNVYRGITNNLGSTPQFSTEIATNEVGVFDGSLLIVERSSGTDQLRYTLSQITNVISNDLIQIDGSISILVPPLELSDEYYKRTSVFISNGGKNFFRNIFRTVSFANLFELINTGSPTVKYFTIDQNGIQGNQTDFVIEFERPDSIKKINTLRNDNDIDKPNTLLILNRNVGYVYKQSDTPKFLIINRYKGYYDPKFIDVFAFSDIGLLENEKNLNLQFDFSPMFGVVKNYFFSKVNIESSNSLLTAVNKYQPVYPLVDEVALSKRDYNVFMSSWDSTYFTKSLDRFVSQYVSGFFSHIESKTFFGSKAMHIPDTIEINSFDVGQYVANNLTKGFSIDFLIEKCIIDILINDGVGAAVDLYSNGYTSIKQKTRYEFLADFIRENILPRYYLNEVKVWALSTNIKQTFPEYDFQATSAQKIQRGYKLFKNYNQNFLNNSRFDVSLINSVSNSLTRYNYYAFTFEIAKNKYRHT
jgi:hypothetical protein